MQKPGVLVWLLILSAAFALRMGAGVWWQLRLPDERWFAMPDSESYWALGRTLATGRPYQFGGPEARVFRTPGYPLLLAAVQRVAGDTQAAVWGTRFVGALLGAAVVALVIVWARAVAGPPAGVLAGLFVAVYPGAIAMSLLVLSEMLFCPLMLAHLLTWRQALRAPAARHGAVWGILAGLLAGAASLVRPSWLLFVPFAAGLGVVLGPDRRRHIMLALLVLAGLAVAMTPWWYRNYQVTGRWVLTTLQVGASLYDGLNPRATGASDMDFVGPMTQALRDRREAERVTADEPFEVALDQSMRTAAVRWARSHPRRVLQLAGIKLRRIWNLWPNAEELQSRAVRWAVALTYGPLLLLSLLGVWRYFRGEWLAWTPAVYFTLLHMIFVSSIRYREPAMLSLIVLGSAWLSEHLPAARGTRTGAPRAVIAGGGEARR